MIFAKIKNWRIGNANPYAHGHKKFKLQCQVSGSMGCQTTFDRGIGIGTSQHITKFPRSTEVMTVTPPYTEQSKNCQWLSQ